MTEKGARAFSQNSWGVTLMRAARMTMCRRKNARLVICSRLKEASDMGRRVMLLAAALICAALLVPGCVADEAPAEPTAPGEEFLKPDEAFEAVLTWLRVEYPDRAPEEGLSWGAEDVVVLGPDGQPLLGAAERSFTATGWASEVYWAVVSPEFIVYQIVLKSPTLGWFWEGTVRARGGQFSEETGMQQMTEELAEELAMQFVYGSPTYLSSGMSGTLRRVESRQDSRPYSWAVVFEFDSRNSGYGDTAGQVVLPVITPHRVVVTVAAMEVVEAVMDGKWDMLAQVFLDADEADARRVAEEFVRNSPTFVFDGIPATLEVGETPYPDLESAWTFVIRFESAHAGYGDRTGQMVAEVITPHEAHITVENGKVVSALMDGEWDMLAQRLV